LSSIGSFAGILGARLGLPVLDPIVCLIICGMIIRVAVMIFRDAVGKMTDRSCDDKIEESLRAAVLEHEFVRGIDKLNTRQFGERIYIDAEIAVDGTIPLSEAHGIAEDVHKTIEERFPQVKHIMIHVNPEEG
jgi:cation diffusion facilitator family transporter